MNSHTQLMPYRNDEVVLYMDELNGTNVMLQPRRSQGLVRSSSANNREKELLANTINLSPKRPMSLREIDNDPANNQPPSHGPEIDDLDTASRKGDEDENETHGIDDGLLPESEIPIMLQPGEHSGPRYPFDVNVYQQKKTLAQGMMDLALLSANANQFRYVLQAKGHPYYYASLAMISTSLILQIVVGVGLIWNSRYDVKEDNQVLKANNANNWTVIGIFLVTILNVFISSFGVTEPSPVITVPLINAGNPSEVESLKDR